jgi:hypothetical protein
MAYKVFLSYAEEDTNVAKRIFNRLEAKRGVYPYMSEIYPAPGTALWFRLEQEIKRSDCIVVLWTLSGAKSQYVNQEIGVAKSIGKEIIPIVKDEDSIVGALEGLEWIPYNRKFMGRLIRRVIHLKKQNEDRKKRRASIRTLGWWTLFLTLLYILIWLVIRAG